MVQVLVNFDLKKNHLRPLQEEFPSVSFIIEENLADNIEAVRSADIIVTFGFNFPEQVACQAESLKWVQALTAGVDNLPQVELQRKDIMVTTVKGIHGIPMAEHVMGFLLSFSRGLFTLRANQLQKEWNRKVSVGEIYNKTLGVVGVGSIGQEISKRAKAFGMKTLGINNSGGPVDYVDQVMTLDQLPSLLKESDYVVVTLPLTPATYQLFKEEQFKLMKKEGYFLNLARGNVVDENALIKALENKEIAGAALDVFSTEPLPEDSPLWEMENVIITPHLAAISPQYNKRAMEVFRKNLRLYLENKELINVMDWKKGY